MKLSILVAASLAFCGLVNSAQAVPVVISGFVSDLGGVPHTNPNISITVRTFPGGRLVTTQRADPRTGFFRIEVDPELVPNNNTRISITASGTAELNGVTTPVQTDGALVGLAGEVLADFGDRIAVNAEAVNYFIVLVVPKAKTSCYCRLVVRKAKTSRDCRRCRVFRRRR